MHLTGQRILITRATSQADSLKLALEAAGARPVLIPVIEIKEPASWDPFDEALAQLSDYDWVIFASTNAVRSLVERMEEKSIPKEILANRKIGAIGEATAAVLQEHSIAVSFSPDKFVAENFIEQFPDRDKMHGLKILWPRTNVGRTLIADEFTASGAIVDTIEAYRTDLPDNAEELSKRLFDLCNEKQLDLITFASSQTVKNFHQLLKMGLVNYARKKGYIVNPDSIALESSASNLLSGIAIATIGPVTATTARQYYKHVQIEADTHTMEGLLKAIESYYAV
ncbi:hypothetical protein GC174_01395 [bacterium]|nr:hypothetical protein [bacterium]